MTGIVGREQELASLRDFIARTEQGTAALVLEGEAGIGKSTLWLAGVEHAREQGLRVLSSRPAEAERGLAHAGLGDLFEGVLDDVLPALSPPRRRALEVALLVEEASGDSVDRRALDVAVRDALQLLGEREPLLHRGGRCPVARRVLVECARVRAAQAHRRPRARAARPPARRRRAAVGDRAGARSGATARAGGAAQRRCVAPVPARPAGQSRSRGRRCCASTSSRAGIRSSRWSWRACSARTSTRRSRCRFPRRSKSSCARGSPEFRRPRARRLRSRRLWGRRPSRCWSGRASRRRRSFPRSTRT